MNSKKMEQLRKSWGDKPCVHPALKSDVQTRDKICTSCGRIVYSGRRPQDKMVLNHKNNEVRPNQAAE